MVVDYLGREHPHSRLLSAARPRLHGRRMRDRAGSPPRWHPDARYARSLAVGGPRELRRGPPPGNLAPARLLRRPSHRDPSFNEAGLASHGGFLAALGLIVAYIRYRGLPLLPVADTLA